MCPPQDPQSLQGVAPHPCLLAPTFCLSATCLDPSWLPPTGGSGAIKSSRSPGPGTPEPFECLLVPFLPIRTVASPGSGRAELARGQRPPKWEKVDWKREEG